MYTCNEKNPAADFFLLPVFHWAPTINKGRNPCAKPGNKRGPFFSSQCRVRFSFYELRYIQPDQSAHCTRTNKATLTIDIQTTHHKLDYKSDNA